MSESIDTLIGLLKQVLDNPFPTDGYGRSLFTPDYRKGRLSAWLTIANHLDPYLDPETRVKVKRLQRAMTGSGYLADNGVLGPSTEPTFRLGPT